jgi:3-phytase/alkaline phosphatase D
MNQQPGGEEPPLIEFLGMITFPTSFTYQDTIVGGLSALTYHPDRDVYYVLSDDRGRVNAPRFYTVTIDIGDGRLDEGDVTFTGVGFLRDTGGRAYSPGDLDPEGLALSPGETLYISSEGDTDERIDPFVQEYGLNGRWLSALPLPEKFLPTADGSGGVRDNLALESLTRSPAGILLYTAVENALQQDGPETGLDIPSPARILVYDLATGRPGGEYVYVVEPVPASPLPAGEISNGLVELIALDDAGTFLALERAYTAGVGNTIILYTIQLSGATDVSAVAALNAGDIAVDLAGIRPVGKQFLFDVGSVVDRVDNVEGMALGPLLPDGRQTLILVSDNNFNLVQQTQFILLALDPAFRPE